MGARGLLLAPADSAVTAYVNDDEPVALTAGRGAHVRFHRGGNVVRFVWPDGRTERASLQIAHGFQTWAVPADPASCHIVLDVERYFYGVSWTDGSRIIPGIDARGTGTPFGFVTSEVVFHQDELPDTLGSDDHISVVHQVPCESLALQDAALVRSLGYTGHSFDD